MEKNKKKSWWNVSVSDLTADLQSDLENGLTNEIAAERLKEYGSNVLPEAKPPSLILLFLNQFSNFIVWLLIAAAIISGVLNEWIDAIAIAVIIVLNGIIGFVQELSAQKSISALKKLSIPTCKVMRNGNLITIETKNLVPGDLVILEAGDIIPADGRIVDYIQLSTQEAILTGESNPVHKISAPISDEKMAIGDRKNMGFMGTIISTGKRSLIVTETGGSTELGKIASLLRTQEKQLTPLQIKLQKLGHKLVFFCLGIVGVVFLIGYLKGFSFVDLLLISTSLAVAAIPEGLPAIVTITLAIGVRKMAKRRALIRKLPSVETLGCSTVICTDKTGTLTKNELCVKKIWTNEEWIEVSGTGYDPEGDFVLQSKKIEFTSDPSFMKLLEIGMLCNNASLTYSEGDWKIVGDPTEAALLVLGKKGHLEKEGLDKSHPFITEIPFDSERKRMSVVRSSDQGKVLYAKGAPDIIVDLCDKILFQGNTIELNESHRARIVEANQELASKALRVLALAFRELPEEHQSSESIEEKLIFVGLIGMIDPPRPEAKEAMTHSEEAGIFPVMITGDHKDTATAIGAELGLSKEKLQAVTGKELDNWDENKLEENLTHTCIYARVSAEHKLRIVKAWKRKGEVVGVTGDGVNDAPAMKEADIGIAMGIKGSDVAKETADMIVTDDNFASIVQAIEEGRGIYDNILKFVNYLLSSNMAELLIIFAGIALGFKDAQGNPFLSLMPVQLLFLNLLTDGFPAIAFAMDPTDPQAMKKPPRRPNEQILSVHTFFRLFLISVVIAIGTLGACHFGLRESAKHAQTMALTTLVVVELVRVQMVRMPYHISFFSNRWLLMALGSSLLLQVAVVYLPPLQKVLGTVALGLIDWGVILGIAVLIFFLGSLINWLLGRKKI
ncbi:cation-translocating P-type ATPase [Simkania negevensis]|uniref:Putative calcium-transporting ATPase n=1 Tax=Simkania negevensis (strain ATCC VR-1471 / DSM 27360 / Z) TaxID=331113 RepID=F8L2V0_SIMNZ|nr:cation-translocating P-type ATPase [Simkania negevensis]CCB87796.1 putative calcium-transporting ATPase [Simkania negevensis Z]